MRPTPVHAPRGLAGRLLAVALAFVLGLGVPAWAQAAPKLWKATRGAATIYLFGSVHLLRPEVDWKGPKLEAALAASQELWLEIADADNTAAAAPLMQRFGFDAVHPLSAKLSDADRALLAKAAADAGASPAALETMRPWLAATLLSIAPLQRAGYDPALGVDVLILKEARARGLPVKGFETLEQQVHVLADLPPAEEVDMLHHTLAEASDELAQTETLRAAWEAGDEAAIAVLVRKDVSDALYQRLIVERNRRFAAAIDDRLKAGGVATVVVGTGHLVGADSVQAQLTRLGWRIEVE
jgi:uncharacterized protein YbaP (TraB family)